VGPVVFVISLVAFELSWHI